MIRRVRNPVLDTLRAAVNRQGIPLPSNHSSLIQTRAQPLSRPAMGSVENFNGLADKKTSREVPSLPRRTPDLVRGRPQSLRECANT